MNPSGKENWERNIDPAGEKTNQKILFSQTREENLTAMKKRTGYYKYVMFWDKRELLEVKNAIIERKKISEKG